MSDYNIFNNIIIIPAHRINQALPELNNQNAANCNTLILTGTHGITFNEINSLFVKLNELNIEIMSIGVDFSCLANKPNTSDKLNILGNLDSGGLLCVTDLIVENCSHVYLFLKYLFQVGSSADTGIKIYKNLLPNLASIYISYDNNNKSRTILTRALKDNFKIKTITVCSEGSNKAEEKCMLMREIEAKRDLTAILDSYTKRNKLGYKRCHDCCITILAIRMYRFSILSPLDKNIVLRPCKEIYASRGTSTRRS